MENEENNEAQIVEDKKTDKRKLLLTKRYPTKVYKEVISDLQKLAQSTNPDEKVAVFKIIEKCGVKYGSPPSTVIPCIQTALLVYRTQLRWVRNTQHISKIPKN